MVCCLLEVMYTLSFCVMLDSMALAVFCVNFFSPVPSFPETTTASIFAFIKFSFSCSLNKSDLLYMVIVLVVVGSLLMVFFVVGSKT